MRKPESLAAMIAVAILASVVGNGMIGFGIVEDFWPLMALGAVLAIPGTVAVAVCVIAYGVRLGSRHADYERWARERA